MKLEPNYILNSSLMLVTTKASNIISRSTLHPALGEKPPVEVLMSRKVRTVHEAILPKKLCRKGGDAVRRARDYRPGR
ncbi:hypothetical protein ACTXT7_008123 [Hymenolepis weldensis]